MKKFIFSYKILFLFLFPCLILSCGHKDHSDVDKGDGSDSLSIHILRGFNTSSVIDNDLLDSIIQETGANLIRLYFSQKPLVNKTPPYDFNEDAFLDLNRILKWCELNNVKVIIDPHTTPGTRDNYTIFPDDEFWKDPSWKNHLIKLWVRIANTYKGWGNVIAGYDLLNEPAIPDPALYGDQWNNLVAVLVDTIRSIGDQHTIIVEPTGKQVGGNYIDRIPAMGDLKLPKDTNLMVSVHPYMPFAFTYQGLENNPTGLTYPGLISGTYWNKSILKAALRPIRDFQAANNNIPINIGEFGCARAAGPVGDIYLKDLMDLFEEAGWDWAFQAIPGGPVWEPMMPYTNPLSNDPVPLTPNTPRMKLLKEYYKWNQTH